jgi:aryl-alcohol dehydrogenase-like predicted oxidoreductase
LTEESLDKVERISKIALENNVTTAQLALAWILHHKEINSVIIGASRPEQIEENVKAVDVTLNETTMEAIEEALTK